MPPGGPLDPPKENETSANLISHNGTIESVKFTANDDIVFSADDIGIIKQWDLDRNCNLTTYNGHMKSVKTLDFIPGHPYFVSGSNDTTIRLWDMTRGNESLLKYSAHMAPVNHVQFSPDGNWIASAGAEGSVFIWDVREKEPIKEFLDSTSAVRCIQFHPSELLLAAGRTNGTVDIFDLDAKKILKRINLSTGTVKSCLFNEQGDWLFVGTDSGVTVVQWEQDREVDFIEATWSNLSSMKLVKNKLMCGSLEGAQVQVHSMNVDLVGRVMPVARGGGGENALKAFLLAQQQKEGSLGKPSTLRLMGGAGGPQAPHITPPSHHLPHGTTDEDSGSPSSNLSMEMVEDETLTQSRLNALGDCDSDTIEFPYPENRTQYEMLKGGGGSYESWAGTMGEFEEQQNSLASSSSPSYEETSFSTLNQRNVEFKRGHADLTHEAVDQWHSGLYDENYGMAGDQVEDFPVNNAPPPNYAPKSERGGTTTSSAIPTGRLSRQRTSMGLVQPRTGVVRPNVQHAPPAGKLTRASRHSSISMSDLSDTGPKGGGGGGGGAGNFKAGNAVRGRLSRSPPRGKNEFHHLNKENKNARNAINKNNGDVKISAFGRPPTRSRSSFDMRGAGLGPQQLQPPSTARAGAGRESRSQLPRTSRVSGNFDAPYIATSRGSGETRDREMQEIIEGHHRIYQQLCTRHATLTMNKDAAIMHDIVIAIQAIAKMDQGSLVDILGAVLEKQNAMTLDMAIVVLPKLYELLQSDRKFHCIRACDTLRVILTNFLPLIKENSSSWAAHSLGVDITSEERFKKCNECRKWLVRIKQLKDNRPTPNALSQLQNLIVDL